MRQMKLDTHMGKNIGISPLKVYIRFPVTWGPFLESPGNFSGPKSNIQTDIKRIRARVLASKLLHFVSLAHSFIMLDAKLKPPASK